MRSKIERRDGRCRYCIAWGVASVFVLMHGSEKTFGAVVDINLVALSTPSGSDTAASLPPTQSTVAPGASFFVEIWAQTTHSNGLTSVSLDLVYDGSLVDGIGITHTALFPELHSGTIDNPSGLVDDLSGSHLGPCTDEVGVSPNWARVAVIEMSPLGEGALLLESAPTGSPALGAAVCAFGDIDPVGVSFGTISLYITDDEIPAVSEWGLLVMGLLVLVAGTLVMPRVRGNG